MPHTASPDMAGVLWYGKSLAMMIVQRFDAEGDSHDMAVLKMALIRDSFLPSSWQTG